MERPSIDLCPLCLDVLALTSQTSCCLDFICTACGSDFIPPCPNCGLKGLEPTIISDITIELKNIIIESFEPIKLATTTKLDQFKLTIDQLINDSKSSKKLPPNLNTQLTKILNQHIDDNSTSLSFLLKLDHQLGQLNFYTLDFLVKLYRRANTVLKLTPTTVVNQNLNLINMYEHFNILTVTHKSNKYGFYVAENGMTTMVWDGFTNNGVDNEVLYLYYEALVGPNKQLTTTTAFPILGIEFESVSILHLFQDDKSTILACVLINDDNLIIYELLDSCIYEYKTLFFGVLKTIIINSNEIFIITHDHVLKYNFRTEFSQIIQNKHIGDVNIIFVDNYNIYAEFKYYTQKLVKYDLNKNTFTILDEECKEFGLIYTDQVYSLIKDAQTDTLQLKLYGTELILAQMNITTFNVEYFSGKLLIIN